MMNLSVFFAQLFGLYLLIISVTGFLKRKFFLQVVKDLLHSPALIVFAGTFNILLGLTIAITHSIWEWNWKGLITLLGYLAILKGIIRVAFPTFDHMILHVLTKWYWLFLLILFLIGLYLTYEGFNSIDP